MEANSIFGSTLGIQVFLRMVSHRISEWIGTVYYDQVNIMLLYSHQDFAAECAKVGLSLVQISTSVGRSMQESRSLLNQMSYFRFQETLQATSFLPRESF